MILEYHRPESFEAALTLLARADPPTVPLGGGSRLNQPSSQDVAAVDLQLLGLNGFEQRGTSLDLGATLTLQRLLERLKDEGSGLGLSTGLAKAIEHEATYNLRQVGTVAGTLISADGRSPFATACLALGAEITLLPGEGKILLGDLLPLRREKLRGRLATKVTLPANARLAYEYVARTPADLPIVCAALAVWPSGRTRLALGGWGLAPRLAMDGGESAGIETAAANAASSAGDEWASAGYRLEIAKVLANRCLEEIKG